MPDMALSEEQVRQWDQRGAVNVPVPGLVDNPALLTRVRAEMTHGMPWCHHVDHVGNPVKRKGRHSNTNNWTEWGPSLVEVVQLPFFEEVAKCVSPHPEILKT